MRIILATSSLLLGLLTAALAQTVTISTPFETYQGNSAFWALENCISCAGVTYSESLTVNPSTFPSGTVINYSFPSTLSYYSYPEIIWGSEFGGYRKSPNGVTPTPVQINNITKFTGTLDLTLAGDLTNHVLWETYLTDGPNNGVPGTGGHILFEIAVYPHTGEPDFVNWVLGHPFYTYTGPDGFSANVSQIDLGIPHLLVVVLPTNGDVLSGTIDLLALMNSMKDHGIITGNEYLDGWELGVETRGNSGSLTVNQLSYELGTAPQR